MRFHLLALTFSVGTGLLGAGCADEPAVETEGSYLTPEERLMLFDVERADRLLGLSLRPFQQAIREQDEELLRSALASDFRASVPDLPGADFELPEGVQVHSTIVEGRRELDADGFVRWVRSLRGSFERIDTVGFPRFQNSEEIIAGEEAIAESLGAFRIAGRFGETGLLELAGTFRMRHDGFERYEEGEEIDEEEVAVRDNWIHYLDFQEASAVSSAASIFVEVTASSGIDTESFHDNWVEDEKPDVTFTGGIYVADVDGDGHLDLLVGELDGSRLYFGNGDGTFEDSGWKPPVAEIEQVVDTPQGKKKFLTVVEPQVAIFDADNDGKSEVLYCGRFFRWNEAKRKMVWLRNATELPAADAVLCDYDRDGLTDVYFLNSGPRARKHQRGDHKAWFDDDRVTGAANDLWRNTGGLTFEKVTRPANASGGYGRTFAAAWFYANEDDHPDLFGANEFGRNVFLVNNGDGTFAEAEDVDDVFGGFSMGVVSGDLDGDLRSDLYVSNMYSKAGQRVYHHLDLSIYPESARKMFMASVTGNRVYRSRGDLSFDDLTTFAGANAVGWGWSGTMLDVDLDGWLDVYAPCGYRSVDATKPDG